MISPLRDILPVIVLAALASGCGTSSSTSVTAPSARCGVNATAQPAAVGAPGGTGAIAVTTDRECAWDARSESDWLSLSAASGRGDGTLRYTATGNPVVAERRGVVVVNGTRVEIGQAAATCQYAVSRARDTIAAGGGRLEVSVSAQAGCEWATRSDAPWIVIVTGESGRGGGVVSLSVSPNVGAGSRTAALTIAGQNYFIEQAGATTAPLPPGPPNGGTECRFTVSPQNGSFGVEGGALEVSVGASAPTCSWTAASTVPWIVMVGGVGETGSGQRRFVVAANTSTTPRSGGLAVAGANVTVTQAANAPAPGPDTPPPSPPPPTPRLRRRRLRRRRRPRRRRPRRPRRRRPRRRRRRAPSSCRPTP